MMTERLIHDSMVGVHFSLLAKLPHARPLPGFRGGEEEKPGIFCGKTPQNIPEPLTFSPFPREGGRGDGATTKLKYTLW